MRSSCPAHSSRGFTLVELLVVLALVVVLTAATSSALQSITSASSLAKSTSDLSSLLEQARAYAMGNNTYVYVGFQEVSSPQSPASNVGRIAVAVVASQDGTRPYQNSPGVLAGSALVAVSKLTYFDNLHLAAASSLSTSGGMARPSASSNFVDLSDSSLTTSVSFSWPLTGTPLYTFGGPSGTSSVNNVIEIDPQGVARIQTGATYSSTIPSFIEIGLLPTHGGAVATNNNTGANQAAIQIDGMTGAVATYRP